MSENSGYALKALRWILDRFDTNVHKNVYKDSVLRAIGPVSPEYLRELAKKDMEMDSLPLNWYSRL